MVFGERKNKSKIKKSSEYIGIGVRYRTITINKCVFHCMNNCIKILKPEVKYKIRRNNLQERCRIKKCLNKN